MKGITRGGVAYNLDESPYRYTVHYAAHNKCITYAFSSDFYRGNFIQKMFENREKINLSLSNRFGFTIENELLCDLKLYLSIEKRGFLLYQNGERFECPDALRLDGSNLTKKI